MIERRGQVGVIGVIHRGRLYRPGGGIGATPLSVGHSVTLWREEAGGGEAEENRAVTWISETRTAPIEIFWEIRR